MKNDEVHTFSAILTKLESWCVAPLPASFVIEAVQPFGRTPVIATLGEKSWSTSLWTSKEGETMIAVPKKIRGTLDAGDKVTISFMYDFERF